MTDIVAYGTGWFDFKECLLGPMTESAARKSFGASKAIAVEIAPAVGRRVYVIHDPSRSYVEVNFLGWPTDERNRSSLHYSDDCQGGLRLTQILVSSNVPDEAMGGDGAFWTQTIVLDADKPGRATLDVSSIHARFIAELPSAGLQAETGTLRFRRPGFGDYDDLVRPDLVERCLLDLEAFDPSLPNVKEAAGMYEPAPAGLSF